MEEVGFDEIGNRLRAFRTGSGCSPDLVAKKLGISRAALYRYEKGEPIKTEMLSKIADLLDTTVSSLLGVGVEYISSASIFFQRMGQLEQESDRVFVMFGPFSYLLSTDEYDFLLPRVMEESVPEVIRKLPESKGHLLTIGKLLMARKAYFKNSGTNIVSLSSSLEIERFLFNGFSGNYQLCREELSIRRAAAEFEVKNIIKQLEEQPIGVQIGILVDSVPNYGFELFQSSQRSVLAISPYSLGDFPNVRLGTAMITSSPEALKHHHDVVDELWARALKGNEAAKHLQSILNRVRKHIFQTMIAT